MKFDEYKKMLYENAEAYGVPPFMHEELIEYICWGRPTGDFLNFLLCNNLQGTFEKADHVNVHYVRHYLQFLYAVAPAPCWGNVKAVAQWQRLGGVFGRGNVDETVRGDSN